MPRGVSLSVSYASDLCKNSALVGEVPSAQARRLNDFWAQARKLNKFSARLILG